MGRHADCFAGLPAMCSSSDQPSILLEVQQLSPVRSPGQHLAVTGLQPEPHLNQMICTHIQKHISFCSGRCIFTTDFLFVCFFCPSILFSASRQVLEQLKVDCRVVTILEFFYLDTILQYNFIFFHASWKNLLNAEGVQFQIFVFNLIHIQIFFFSLDLTCLLHVQIVIYMQKETFYQICKKAYIKYH